jgi:hypothetical protein
MRRSVKALGLVLAVTGAACVGPTDEQGAPAPTAPIDVPAIETQTCLPFCQPLPEHEVRISPTIVNGTTRSTASVTPLIVNAIRAKLSADPSIDVDEGSEPTNTNHALLVRGQLSQITYASGNLTVKVSLVVYSYPGLALKGVIPKTLTMQGVAPVDQAKEDQLISLGASLATEQFINNLDAFE